MSSSKARATSFSTPARMAQPGQRWLMAEEGPFPAVLLPDPNLPHADTTDLQAQLHEALARAGISSFLRGVSTKHAELAVPALLELYQPLLDAAQVLVLVLSRETLIHLLDEYHRSETSADCVNPALLQYAAELSLSPEFTGYVHTIVVIEEDGGPMPFVSLVDPDEWAKVARSLLSCLDSTSEALPQLKDNLSVLLNAGVGTVIGPKTTPAQVFQVVEDVVVGHRQRQPDNILCPFLELPDPAIPRVCFGGAGEDGLPFPNLFVSTAVASAEDSAAFEPNSLQAIAELESTSVDVITKDRCHQTKLSQSLRCKLSSDVDGERLWFVCASTPAALLTSVTIATESGTLHTVDVQSTTKNPHLRILEEPVLDCGSHDTKLIVFDLGINTKQCKTFVITTEYLGLLPWLDQRLFLVLPNTIAPSRPNGPLGNNPSDSIRLRRTSQRGTLRAAGRFTFSSACTDASVLTHHPDLEWRPRSGKKPSFELESDQPQLGQDLVVRISFPEETVLAAIEQDEEGSTCCVALTLPPASASGDQGSMTTNHVVLAVELDAHLPRIRHHIEDLIKGLCSFIENEAAALECFVSFQLIAFDSKSVHNIRHPFSTEEPIESCVDDLLQAWKRPNQHSGGASRNSPVSTLFDADWSRRQDTCAVVLGSGMWAEALLRDSSTLDHIDCAVHSVCLGFASAPLTAVHTICSRLRGACVWVPPFAAQQQQSSSLMALGRAVVRGHVPAQVTLQTKRDRAGVNLKQTLRLYPGIGTQVFMPYNDSNNLATGFQLVGAKPPADDGGQKCWLAEELWPKRSTMGHLVHQVGYIWMRQNRQHTSSSSPLKYKLPAQDQAFITEPLVPVLNLPSTCDPAYKTALIPASEKDKEAVLSKMYQWYARLKEIHLPRSPTKDAEQTETSPGSGRLSRADTEQSDQDVHVGTPDEIEVAETELSSPSVGDRGESALTAEAVVVQSDRKQSEFTPAIADDLIRVANASRTLFRFDGGSEVLLSDTEADLSNHNQRQRQTKVRRTATVVQHHGRNSTCNSSFRELEATLTSAEAQITQLFKDDSAVRQHLLHNDTEFGYNLIRLRRRAHKQRFREKLTVYKTNLPGWNEAVYESPLGLPGTTHFAVNILASSDPVVIGRVGPAWIRITQEHISILSQRSGRCLWITTSGRLARLQARQDICFLFVVLDKQQMAIAGRDSSSSESQTGKLVLQSERAPAIAELLRQLCSLE